MDTAPRPCTCVQGPKKPTHRIRAPQLRNLRCFLHSEPPSSCRCTQRACNNIVQAGIRRAATVGSRRTCHNLHPRNLLDLHIGTSKTLSMNCNWGIFMVHKTAGTMENRLCVTKGMSTNCRCTQRACERPCPRTLSQCAATVGSRL